MRPEEEKLGIAQLGGALRQSASELRGGLDAARADQAATLETLERVGQLMTELATCASELGLDGASRSGRLGSGALVRLASEPEDAELVLGLAGQMLDEAERLGEELESGETAASFSESILQDLAAIAGAGAEEADASVEAVVPPPSEELPAIDAAMEAEPFVVENEPIAAEPQASVVEEAAEVAAEEPTERIDDVEPPLDIAEEVLPAATDEPARLGAEFEVVDGLEAEAAFELDPVEPCDVVDAGDTHAVAEVAVDVAGETGQVESAIVDVLPEPEAVIDGEMAPDALPAEGDETSSAEIHGEAEFALEAAAEGIPPDNFAADASVLDAASVDDVAMDVAAPIEPDAVASVDEIAEREADTILYGMTIPERISADYARPAVAAEQKASDIDAIAEEATRLLDELMSGTSSTLPALDNSGPSDVSGQASSESDVAAEALPLPESSEIAEAGAAEAELAAEPMASDAFDGNAVGFDGASGEALPDAGAEASGPTELTPEEIAALSGGSPMDMSGGPAELTPEQLAALMGDGFDAGVQQAWGSFPLTLAPEKAEILQFMVADAGVAMQSMDQVIGLMSQYSARDEAATSLKELTSAFQKLSEFFGFASLDALTTLLIEIADGMGTVPEELMSELVIRVRAIKSLLDQHIRGLECGMEMRWPLDTLAERVRHLLIGQQVDAAILGWHDQDPARLLELDLVVEGIEAPPKPGDPVKARAVVATPEQSVAAGGASGPVAGAAAAANEPMVRVSAAALDQLLSMLSQLVLVKNRMFMLSREVRQVERREMRIEQIGTAADELHQLTAGLQLTMMRARMQPIERLFERYPRVVRDVASLADKQVELKLDGHGTQIDKSLFDALAEPLAQLLRFIVTQQVEPPSERAAAGKEAWATIELTAENQGASILVRVSHNGIHLKREELLDQAVETGLIEAEAGRAMSDDAVFALMFRPEFGEQTLAKVAAQVTEQKGKVQVRSEPGKGVTFDLSLPLSMAIVRAIMIESGGEVYAVPLQSVVEIVRVGDVKTGTIHGRMVVRLRDEVVPMIDITKLLGGDDAHSAGQFGLIVSAAEQRAALRVDRIVGSQEVVIKALDEQYASSTHFCGATIRDDGRVSLIFDVARLVGEAGSRIDALEPRVIEDQTPVAA
jgi:two-component system, chemotaxis family, sensor kinase CheA